MNNIGMVLCSNFLMFPDNMNVFKIVASPTSHNNLQCSLNNISNWCRMNAMELNAFKCAVISN